MYLEYGNLNYIKDWASDTLNKRMLLIVLFMGGLTAYSMFSFPSLKRNNLLIEAFSSRIIHNSHHSCFDHVALNTVKNEAVEET